MKPFSAMHSTRYYWLATSPLWAYVLCFFSVFVCYQLKWSTIYPPLSPAVVVFVFFTIAVSLVVAGSEWVVWRAPSAPPDSWWTLSRVRGATLLIYAATLAEWIHAGGIPLELVLSGADYDYSTFGIPTFHVVVFGLYWFLCVHWYSLWLRGYGRSFVFYSVALLTIDVLTVNRGGLLQALIAFAILYVARAGAGLKALLKIAGIFAAVVLLFGYIGDARLGASGIDTEAAILALGGASEDYNADVLGTGPFWIYLYASSPLGNWQLNVSEATTIHADAWTFIRLEMLPDFIGKRLTDPSVYETSPMLVSTALNVTSAYGRAFYLMGWGGCATVFSYLLVFYMSTRVMFRRSEYFDSAIATMAAGSSLMTFSNTLVFSGFVAPMLVAIVLRAMFRVRRANPRNANGINPASLGQLD
jgi:hypothetical protein